MVFALILTLAGFVGEYLESDAASIGSVRAELDAKTKKLAEVEERYRRVSEKLRSFRELMQELMSQKSGSSESDV